RKIADSTNYPGKSQLVLSRVAVEKGTKAVISVNFSAYGKRRFNNLRANFVREIPREEFFNTYACLRQLRKRLWEFRAVCWHSESRHLRDFAAASASRSRESRSLLFRSLPATITAEISFVFEIFTSGFASKTNRSPVFPTSTLPIESVMPRN